MNPLLYKYWQEENTIAATVLWLSIFKYLPMDSVNPSPSQRKTLLNYKMLCFSNQPGLQQGPSCVPEERDVQQVQRSRLLTAYRQHYAGRRHKLLYENWYPFSDRAHFGISYISFKFTLFMGIFKGFLWDIFCIGFDQQFKKHWIWTLTRKNHTDPTGSGSGSVSANWREDTY